MPAPTLSHHRATHRGYITWKKRRVYIPGRWPADQKNPPLEIVAGYGEILRRLAREVQADGTQDSTQDFAQAEKQVVPHIPVWRLAKDFLVWARTHYQVSNEAESLAFAIKPLVELFGELPAADFSPKKLKAYRAHLEAQGKTRQGVNKKCNLVKRVFRWGAEEELIPVTVHQALRVVSPLRKGHTAAPESVRKGLVDEETVKATLPHLPRQVAALVELGLHCGARPSELCRITTGAIDRTDAEVWFFVPVTHKTASRGKVRQIPLGPKCIEILKPFLRDDEPDAFLFSPKERMEELRQEMRASRQTKVQPSQLDRSKAEPEKKPRDRYDTDSLIGAIHAAC